MCATFDSFVMVHGHDAKFDVVLRISLSYIDNIEVSCAVSKARMRAVVFRGIRAGNPGHLLIRVGVKLLVVKINVQLPKFPQVKADVLSSVSYCSVGTDD